MNFQINLSLGKTAGCRRYDKEKYNILLRNGRESIFNRNKKNKQVKVSTLKPYVLGTYGLHGIHTGRLQGGDNSC